MPHVGKAPVLSDLSSCWLRLCAMPRPPRSHAGSRRPKLASGSAPNSCSPEAHGGTAARRYFQVPKRVLEHVYGAEGDDDDDADFEDEAEEEPASDSDADGEPAGSAAGSPAELAVAEDGATGEGVHLSTGCPKALKPESQRPKDSRYQCLKPFVKLPNSISSLLDDRGLDNIHILVH